MDKPTKLLSYLDETIKCTHLDMGGKHRYALTVRSHPIIQEIRAYLAEEACPLREKLAALCHEQWSGWMDHLFSTCQLRHDGSAIIPSSAVKRRQRLMITPYTDLPENEKEKDRKEADKFLEILRGHE